jgi:formylglycine-generating enzyme required for sulfatase activity
MEFWARLSRKTGRAYRLPTEAEWEYACRAGTMTPFAFGETITPELVNYQSEHPYGEGQKGEFRETTLDVGYFGVANGFGLYDMHGNVMEWCLDVWHEDYDGAPADGGPWLSGDSRRRVLRGGSELNDAFVCRSAFRNGVFSDNSRPNIGFRVVAVAQL